MNYSDEPSMCRVDFFKQSGKWYTTESIKWLTWSRKMLIHDAFREALRNHFEEHPNRLADMDAICLEPYHEMSHPIQLKAGKW